MSRAALGARPPAPPEMTLEEWADLDEDEPGELVDGVLEEEEMPTFLHEAVVSWLQYVLRGWAAPRGGWVFGSEAKYAVKPRRGRKPDLSVYLPGAKMPAAGDGLGRTPPSIVVEVVSARPRDARRDRIDKVADYQAFGVPLYWIIEPRVRTLEVLDLSAEHPVLVLSAATGQHDAPGCEGLRLDLDALWAEIDRLPEGDRDEAAD
jgi:Uma2 family endonuclease